MTNAVHIALDEVIGALQTYACGLLGREVQIIGESNNRSAASSVEAMGRVPLFLPKVMDAFKTRELNELYFKFLVTFDVSRHLFGSFVVDPELLEERVRIFEREREKTLQTLVQELNQNNEVVDKGVRALKERIHVLKGSSIKMPVLAAGLNIREVLKSLVPDTERDGVMRTYDTGTHLVACYQLIELARVSYLMREEWPGLSKQMDSLFVDGARHEGARVIGAMYEPQKNSLVDQLGLYAVAPQKEHKGRDSKQTRLVREEGVKFFEPVRQEGAATADSVVQAIMLYRWVKSKYQEGNLAMLPASLPGVGEVYDARVEKGACSSEKPVRTKKKTVRESADCLFFDEFDVKSGAYVKKFCKISVGDWALYERKSFDAVKKQKRMFPFERGVLDEIVAAFGEIRPEARSVRKKEKSGELDSDRVVDYIVDMRSGRTPDERVYERVLKGNRDVAVAVLVDASGSVNRFLTKETAIFDLVRESVFYLSQGLDALGDEYAIFAHQSCSAYDVRVRPIKCFGEKKGFPQIMNCLAELTAKKNNHDGAVIRYATHLLDNWQAKTKLILHISDGEPKDVPLTVFEKERDADVKKRGNWLKDGYVVPKLHEPFKKFPYQGERAWADVKKAAHEALLRNVQVCYVRIGEEPSTAAREVFGRNQIFVRDMTEFARELSKFYISMTR